MNKLIEPDKDVSDKNSQLPNVLAPIIQRHRIDQQNKKLRGDRRTIIWTSKGEQKNLASIAFVDYIRDDAAYVSGIRHLPIGILDFMKTTM